MGKTTTKTLTMASAFETIYKKAHNSELNEAIYFNIAKEALYIKAKLNLTGDDAKIIILKAIIIAFAIDKDGSFVVSEVGRWLGLSKIAFLSYSKTITDLYEEGFLHQEVTRRNGDACIAYSLPTSLLQCIIEDKEFVRYDTRNLSAKEFLGQVTRWMIITDNDTDYYEKMVRDIRLLIDNTQHLHLSRELAALSHEKEDGGLDDAHMVLFLLCASRQILGHSRRITRIQYEDILEQSFQLEELVQDLDDQIDVLSPSKLNLLESEISDGMASPGEYCLTQHACDTILKEYHFTPRKAEVSSGMIMPESIKPKTLFYNKREGEQIARLTNLMQPENLESVQQRLAESGLRTGMCILFHGAAPGTGKTESVMQICRKTGHPIMKVDMSTVKSKWVGDSEKNLQQIFDNYKNEVADCRKKGSPIPVLLLNEADGLISQRSQNAETSVDKMQNTMQNIILQNMEDLDGILFATTNLAANFDKANERRWLMNIHFEKPDDNARQQILRSMIPELSKTEAKQLAEEFPAFAGGQYENITRRLKIEQIINDTPFSVGLVKRLCQEEGIKETTSRQPIGFC